MQEESEKLKDKIEYNGQTYYKYESTAPYYEGSDVDEGHERMLHREIYENEIGEIPDNHHIHHIDGDATNNDPSNLQAMPEKEHLELHDADPEALEKGRKMSPEGSRELWEEHIKPLFEPVEGECKVCGDSFEDTTADNSRIYCSEKCKSLYRRQNDLDKEEVVCEYCGDTFLCKIGKDQQTCSRSCGQKLRYERTGAVKDGDSQRECCICGEEYSCAEDSESQTCSMSCKQTLVNRNA